MRSSQLCSRSVVPGPYHWHYSTEAARATAVFVDERSIPLGSATNSQVAATDWCADTLVATAKHKMQLIAPRTDPAAGGLALRHEGGSHDPRRPV